MKTVRRSGNGSLQWAGKQFPAHFLQPIPHQMASVVVRSAATLHNRSPGSGFSTSPSILPALMHECCPCSIGMDTGRTRSCAGTVSDGHPDGFIHSGGKCHVPIGAHRKPAGFDPHTYTVIIAEAVDKVFCIGLPVWKIQKEYMLSVPLFRRSDLRRHRPDLFQQKILYVEL